MAFTLQGIIDNHVYVGGVKNTSSPKTKQYRSTVENGTVVLDPEKQLTKLNDLYVAVQEAKQANKDIVVIAQKS